MEKLRTGLPIDATNLDKELAHQAANYLYVAEKAIEAEQTHETYKAQVGQLEASLDAKVRDDFAAAGKKMTEAAIRMAIEAMPDFQKAQKQLIALRARKEVLKALRESYYMRKDLLIQMAIKQRSELEAMLSENVKMKKAA